MQFACRTLSLNPDKNLAHTNPRARAAGPEAVGTLTYRLSKGPYGKKHHRRCGIAVAIIEAVSIAHAVRGISPRAR